MTLDGSGRDISLLLAAGANEGFGAPTASLEITESVAVTHGFERFDAWRSFVRAYDGLELSIADSEERQEIRTFSVNALGAVRSWNSEPAPPGSRSARIRATLGFNTIPVGSLDHVTVLVAETGLGVLVYGYQAYGLGHGPADFVPELLTYLRTGTAALQKLDG